MDTLFIMGPQGSGKGTQARILAEKLGFFHWEMGGILRQERDFRLSNGKTVGDIIDNGIYLTDEELKEIVDKRIGDIKAGIGIIFDGIPRRVGQAEFLMDILSKQKRKDIVTLLISLPREETMKRLLLRAKTENRGDDTPEKIELRLTQYEEGIGPLLEYLKTHTKFIEIDGTPAIPEVTKEINKVLGIN